MPLYAIIETCRYTTEAPSAEAALETYLADPDPGGKDSLFAFDGVIERFIEGESGETRDVTRDGL